MSNRGRHRTSNKHPLVKLLGREVAKKMMYHQEKQGSKPNLDVFLKDPTASKNNKGFTWEYTDEGWSYWNNIANKIYNMDHHGRS